MRFFNFGKKKIDGDIAKTVQLVSHNKLLSYGVANLQGVGKRARQEDSFVFVNALDDAKIRREGLIFAVADGMGGMRDGKVASDEAVTGIRELFKRTDRGADIAIQLRDGVFEIGERILQVLGGNGGSTVAACMIFNERLYFVSVGDSFIYLMRDSHLYRLNKEHNLLNQRYLENIKAGNLDKSKILRDDEDEALTQFLGMEGMSEVDFLRRPIPLRNGDTILVCSDGVGGVLSEKTILSCMEMGAPNKICDAMESQIEVQERVNQDNYTALVVKCGY